jgi:hypothetical protein
MRSIVVAAVVALLPLSAGAQPVSDASGPDTYLQVHLGAFVPRGDLDQLDTGFTVGGAFGARFTRHLAVEGAVAFERATSSGPGSITLNDVPIAVSLVARLPFKQGELAAYGGPDLHVVHLAMDGPPSRSWDEVGFGGHYGVRAAANLWPTALVGIDLSGTIAEAKLDRTTRLDAFRLAVMLQYRF